MAPSLLRRTDDDVFNTQTISQPETRANTGVAMIPWLIVVIIVGVLIVTGLVVFLVLCYTGKWRRTARDSQANPPSRQKFRRRKMSTTDRQAAEEMERAIMIRKSLASRSSSWSNTGASDYKLVELQREESDPMAPRANWKDEEAGMPGSRTSLAIRDIEMGVHPALLPQPQLAIPQPSRAPSPARGVKPPPLIIPP
ncbi:hypothetical protein F4677DRAFT_346639 [Hypoxylon crocopeplum]|nr:hypothetical protein F4677DRAFT_346639 [Hypoxylon crocopeplum]